MPPPGSGSLRSQFAAASERGERVDCPGFALALGASDEDQQTPACAERGRRDQVGGCAS